MLRNQSFPGPFRIVNFKGIIYTLALIHTQDILETRLWWWGIDHSSTLVSSRDNRTKLSYYQPGTDSYQSKPEKRGLDCIFRKETLLAYQ